MILMMMPSMRLAGVEYEAVPAGVRRGQGCPWWPHGDDDMIMKINDYDDDDDDTAELQLAGTQGRLKGLCLSLNTNSSDINCC